MSKQILVYGVSCKSFRQKGWELGRIYDINWGG